MKAATLFWPVNFSSFALAFAYLSTRPFSDRGSLALAAFVASSFFALIPNMLLFVKNLFFERGYKLELGILLAITLNAGAIFMAYFANLD